MTGALVRLFIDRRLIPHDGKRYAIADGYVERQEAPPGDDQLAAELAAALDEEPGVNAVRDAGREAWQRRGGAA